MLDMGPVLCYSVFLHTKDNPMNELIRKLAIENGLLHEHMTVGEYNDSLKKFEEFAELIVRECAHIADCADATREKWQSIGKFVREHFGVE
jgi:hypothetical protein